MLELLAPAGSMEALRAAVQNGADAVYLGCGPFNARQSAKNFTPQTLVEAVKYCHIRGVKVHLTLNTLVSDRELSELIHLIRHAALSGVDAFIVQDLGVVRLCRQIAPHIPIHGSTQMTVHSLSGVQFCASLGMTRVVLSRELTREDIRYIAGSSPIEIEVFGHGALCMCYSGQCYLSAVIGGRSGNRGRCAQPCRQSYGYGRWENKYPLSLKDNCLVDYVKELETMGVASLKLEGRMKRPEYVATVTSVYRRAIDDGHVTQPMRRDLMAAFNRQGFTADYYNDSVSRRMFGIRADEKESGEWLQRARLSYESGENPLVDIAFRAVVTREGSALSVTDTDGHHCTVAGPRPEVARTVMLTAEALIQRLNKTGGTPYNCVDVQAQVEPGLMLSAAALNAMRRDVLSRLTVLRARHEQPQIFRPTRFSDLSGTPTPPGLTVQITGREQITKKLLSMPLSLLYIPLHLLTEDLEFCKDLAAALPVAAVLPRICHDGEMPKLKDALLAIRDRGVKDVLVGNVGHILPAKDMGMRIHGDFGLNLYNSGSMDTMKELGLASVTMSFEMTLPQIRDVSKPVAPELIIYGRLPLMITENCLMQNKTGQCSCHLGTMKLVDKTGAEFPVIKDGATCRSVLLNGKKLSWLDRRMELEKLGLWALRLYFTTENRLEVDRVLRAYLEPGEFDPGSCTRGLYLRGVE